ncbi:MAG: PilN domain-containing protein [Deltaproteobacteria bacterium]|nr:PilN domain-containing protein [Deltaproteobacteria bacterium]
MIRINLLPARAEKKKESTRLQLMIAGGVTVIVLLVSFAVYLYEMSEASSQSSKITSAKAELEVLKGKIGELSKIEQQKKVVEEKLNIIKSLEAAKTGPVDLFKLIGDAMPERAWLKSLKDDGKTVSLTGFAVNQEVMSDLMKNLQRHKGFSSVDLIIAQVISEGETRSEVVSFDLKLNRVAAGEKSKDKGGLPPSKEKK